MTATEKRTLHTKLAQIMYEAERIPKNGTAPVQMGGYRFVQVGDAADYIRKALAEHKITMLPTSVQVVGQIDRPTKSGGTMTTVDLLMEWTLTDGDSGESITIMSFGAGADGGDKYSGKASTSAMKYALLTGFLLSTGDDTEAHVTPETRPRNGAPGFVQTKDHPVELPNANGGLIGIASLGKIAPVDGLVRQTPEGNSVGFVIGEGREKVQVVAYGDLAESLAVVLNDTIGKRVQVFGPTSPETMKAGGKTIPFLRMRLERIEGPGWTIPRTEALPPPLFDDLPEPPDDVPLVGEKEAAA